LSQESHAAFAAARRLGNVAVFADRMAPLVAAYRARVRPTLLVRACLLARRLFIAAWKRRTHGGAGHST
jgi:hypothetical protein